MNNRGSDEKSKVRALHRYAGWIASNATLVLTLLAGALYVVVWWAYNLFYGRLGVDPSDVGVTYSTALSTALPRLLVLLLAFSASGFLFIFALSKIFRARISVREAAVIAISGAVLLGLPALLWSERDEAGVVRAGDRGSGNFLHCRAQRARLDWRGAGKPPAIAHTPVFYLGTADGFVVVYSPSRKRVFRVPQSLVIVESCTGDNAFEGKWPSCAKG